jgi:hypothetical protein
MVNKAEIEIVEDVARAAAETDIGQSVMTTGAKLFEDSRAGRLIENTGMVRLGDALKDYLDKSETGDLHLPPLDFASGANPRFAHIPDIDPDKMAAEIARLPKNSYPGNLKE